MINRVAPGEEGSEREVGPGSGVGQEGVRERLALSAGTLTAGPQGSDYRSNATIARLPTASLVVRGIDTRETRWMRRCGWAVIDD